MMNYHAPFNKKKHKKHNKALGCTWSNGRRHNTNKKNDLIRKKELNEKNRDYNKPSIRQHNGTETLYRSSLSFNWTSKSLFFTQGTLSGSHQDSALERSPSVGFGYERAIEPFDKPMS